MTQLAALRSEVVQTQVRQIALTDVQQFLDDFLKVLDTGTIRQKQALVRRFIERVDVHLDHLRIKLAFGLEEMVKLPELEALKLKESYVNLAQ